MADLVLMRRLKDGETRLVGVFDHLDTNKCVMFVDSEGYITYGTKAYLDGTYIEVSDTYKFTIERKTALFVTPAYGRRYKSVEALRADWKSGKDFKILNGPYLSIRNHVNKSIIAIEWGSPGQWTAVVLQEREPSRVRDEPSYGQGCR